ncbi:Protein spinster like protein [Argiope bruennichi]|uniref:Protein spinster like protein n=1 Tax=Argiope bruennichi TaxID=94029 RepID=A0A8T0FKF4_ARGBR|nr:Protein spinster like protein [Argiope bruennichi]
MGLFTFFWGIVVYFLGSSSKFREKYNPRADPLICAYSMILAVPLVYLACITASPYTYLSYVFIFFGVTLLCMNWVLVADIVLYVVVPRRRSMAEAIQITVSHLLGDACSPYIVGRISDRISGGDESPMAKYLSMQYSLFIPVFILVVGASCFFINSFYVVEDKERCSKQMQGDISAALLSNIVDVSESDNLHKRINSSDPDNSP